MSRRTPGRDAALAEIRREDERQRRDRVARDRADELEREHDDEDRALDRARMRAVFRAPADRREAVADAYDRGEADVLRARARPTRPPAIDLDAGRGADVEAPPTPTWRNPTGR